MQQKLNKERVLANLKKLNGIAEGQHDEKLLVVIDGIIDEIKIYCNYGDRELPKKFESTIINLAQEYLRYNNLGIQELADSIKSITQGDTKIEYALGSIISSAIGYGTLGSTIKLLNSLKRVRMA